METVKSHINEELFCKKRYRHFQNSRDEKVIFQINRFSITVRRFNLQDLRLERWKFKLVIKLFCFIYQQRRNLLFCFDEIFLSKNRYRVLQINSSNVSIIFECTVIDHGNYMTSLYKLHIESA